MGYNERIMLKTVLAVITVVCLSSGTYAQRTTFWMPMNEILKFTVDKGIMTVIKKDGGITRYNILDVEKTTIQ